ncbi:MAG: Mut7-C ubiquitin/RNAse domain-containing protein [Gammaproteobacteria bacterium]|nr:Mut7-C ubiquitin/RNAse domain-containing protein [Gammaproteobacteria bacterium]
MKSYLANFRFYEELNDFLAPGCYKEILEYRFDGRPAIKDPIETLGVPHSEVDLILVNDDSVGFDYRLQHGDRVAVYPMFESLDISPLQHLRAKPLRVTRFMVDVNLGKLARLLRMLGFDTAYGNRLEDGEIVEIAIREKRIILTRDRRLLFRRTVTHGFWVRSDDPETQLGEVMQRLDLAAQVNPLQRCLQCNGLIESVDREQVWASLEPLTRRYYSEFYRCSSCHKVYWEGSHVEHMSDAIRQMLGPRR